MSHPSRVRGLKFKVFSGEVISAFVAPFTGAWIEIKIMNYSVWMLLIRRTLHGCVD